MLKHYSHIRTEAKRRALEVIVTKKADAKPAEQKSAVPAEVPTVAVGEARSTSTHP
jgi:hypothetical protein